MPKNPDFPQDLRLYSQGARPDIDPEVLPQTGQGLYHNAFNMRPNSERGSQGAAEKAGYAAKTFTPPFGDPNFGGNSQYISLASTFVNDQLVEFWANPTTGIPIITVDGVTVAENSALPIVNGQNFQIDKNENCQGGEVFIFSEGEPIILNIGDMISSKNANSSKYFADFNLQQFSVNIFKPLDIPVFQELVEIGGGGGLSTGSYRYSFRYIQNDPDSPDDIVAATQWSPYTPYINVPENIGPEGSIFIHNATHGGEPNTESTTGIGIRIKFRVTNVLNYDIIQIKRQGSFEGAASDVTPSEFLIAQIPISEGQISVETFLDPTDQTDTELLAEEEALDQTLSFITSAKTGRYFNKQLVLMNVQTASRDDDVTFDSVNSEKIFPVIKKLGKAGLKDAYNDTYFSPISIHGERLSFGAQLYDGIGGKSFVREDDDLKNYQIPNRREAAGTNTQTYSHDTPVSACRIDNTVGPCHEVFDMEDAVFKTDKCSFKNIFDFGKVNVLLRPLVGRLLFSVNIHASIGTHPSCGTSQSAVEAQGASITVSQFVQPGYFPYTPVRTGDIRTDGLNYVATPKAFVSGTGDRAYQPRVFEPNYYSTGIGIAGISSLPTWCKAFSIVRSQEAGRVICQGIGSYSLSEGDLNLIGSDSLVSKDKTGFWFFSPDIYSGVVSDATVEDMKNNPSNYSVQLVAPLGFTTEILGFENTTVGDRDRLIDMITHTNFLYDNGQINNGEFSNIGIADASNNRHVGYGKYRNSNASSAVTGSYDGNREFQLFSFGEIVEGRGRYFNLKLADENGLSVQVYLNGSTGVTGGGPAATFSDNGTKNWHEPFYMINIVRNVDVPDRTINSYYQTAHYQKVESIIGLGNGSAQQLELVDERWEDCIPALDSSSPFASDNYYITIRPETGNDETWVNVTYKSSSERITINNDIVQNGFWDPGDGTQVRGMYTHTSSSDLRTHTIVLDQFSHRAPSNSYIIVKYDSRKPLQVFGGNVSIGDSIHAPLDKTAKANDGDGPNFAMGPGFPYNKYSVNARHYIIANLNGTVVGTLQNFIQDAFNISEVHCHTALIRQWCLMFTCEARTALHLAFGTEHYPQVNYVIRPNRNDNTGNIQDGYFEDYFFSEEDRWSKGGFRFLPQFNQDYMKEPQAEFFSKPAVGFTEQNDYCTRVIWSNQRQTNLQNSPSLKTFNSLNSIDLDDDQGDINIAWDAMTDKGENLYAITERGICLLITNKQILSDLNSDEIGLFAQDNFISGQYWLDKNIGIPDTFIDTFTEASAGYQSQSGKVRRETMFFANENGVYRFSNNQLTDILSGKYASILRPELDALDDGTYSYAVAGYDPEHDEYILGFENNFPHVFSQSNNEWAGTMSFIFNSFAQDGRKIFGSIALESYRLNSGTTLYGISEGQPESWIIQVSSMDFTSAKDFPAIQVNSNLKPEKIEIILFDPQDPMNQTVIGTIDGADLRNYGHFEQDIPRRSDNSERINGRYLAYKIYHANDDGEFDIAQKDQFRIISSKVSHKNLY